MDNMIFSLCALTDAGLIRSNNEDAVIFDQASGVAVLADGMGGYNAGEVASSMTTQIVHAELNRWLAENGKKATIQELRRAVEDSVEKANAAVYQEATTNDLCAGMGTTLVVAVIRQGSLLIGHIGDSRCYRLRNGQLTQLTKDHSLLQEQIDAGLMTPEQAAQSLNKNLVTRALGVEPGVQLDLQEQFLEAGDVYLLCSDGLTDMVKDREIERILQMPMVPEQRARMLVDMANAMGGRDNITVLLAQIGADAGKRSLVDRILRK